LFPSLHKPPLFPRDFPERRAGMGLPPQPRSHPVQRPQHGAARMSRDINRLEHGGFAGDAAPARRPGQIRAAVSLCETDGTRLEMSGRCGVFGMGRMRGLSWCIPAPDLAPCPLATPGPGIRALCASGLGDCRGARLSRDGPSGTCGIQLFIHCALAHLSPPDATVTRLPQRFSQLPGG